MKAINKTAQRPVNKWRLSTLFGPDGRVLPYNYKVALGKHALYILTKNNFVKLEGTLMRNRASSNNNYNYNNNATTTTNNANATTTNNNNNGNNRMIDKLTFNMLKNKDANMTNDTMPRQSSPRRSLYNSNVAYSTNRTTSVRLLQRSAASVLTPYANVANSNEDNDEMVAADFDSSSQEFVVHTTMIKQEAGRCCIACVCCIVYSHVYYCLPILILIVVQ